MFRGETVKASQSPRDAALLALFAVIPGRASWREPGIHQDAAMVARWIPGSSLRDAPE
jgi:hypothetical protein